MSRAYKIHNPVGVYFLSFATVGWIDVFTRNRYKDILYRLDKIYSPILLRFIALLFCIHRHYTKIELDYLLNQIGIS